MKAQKHIEPQTNIHRDMVLLYVPLNNLSCYMYTCVCVCVRVWDPLNLD